MKKLRVWVLLLGVVTVVIAFPRRAAADDFGRNVLIGAFIGGAVGGIVAIVRASSALPKPAPIATAPHGPPGWVAGVLASQAARETATSTDTESPWSRGVILTF